MPVEQQTCGGTADGSERHGEPAWDWVGGEMGEVEEMTHSVVEERIEGMPAQGAGGSTQRERPQNDGGSRRRSGRNPDRAECWSPAQPRRHLAYQFDLAGKALGGQVTTLCLIQLLHCCQPCAVVARSGRCQTEDDGERPTKHSTAKAELGIEAA